MVSILPRGPRHGPWAVSLLLALLVFAPACLKSQASCSVCGRTECRAMVFTIHLKDGTAKNTCCPRCGLHYLEGEHPAVASLSVRDFATAKTLDADAAVYVDGSDVTPCTSMAGAPPGDERGCCLKPVYDRCTPSLIPFASRDTARKFADVHGGIVRTFAEVRALKPPSPRSSG
jgi:DeoR family transcriptional regulator, copper-sensing transcriptional repressor